MLKINYPFILGLWSAQGFLEVRKYFYSLICRSKYNVILTHMELTAPLIEYIVKCILNKWNLSLHLRILVTAITIFKTKY